jgi:hypothetical protein
MIHSVFTSSRLVQSCVTLWSNDVHSSRLLTLPRLNELIALALAGDVLCCRLLTYCLLCFVMSVSAAATARQNCCGVLRPCLRQRKTPLRAFPHSESSTPWRCKRTVHKAAFVRYLRRFLGGSSIVLV